MSGESTRKIRVFIVEDETIVARDLQRMLEGLNYEPAGTAGSGEQALEMIAAELPDLVLMDIALQGGHDGIETADEIRRRFRRPVIFITALGDAPTLHRAKRTEPFGYLFKPFEQREIHAAIEMALYKHAMEESLRESEAKWRYSEGKFRAASERLQNLTRHLQDAGEKERTRLAHELHDELGQTLTAMKMDIAWILSKLPEGENALRARVADLAKLSDYTLKSVRRLSQEMRPGVLDDLGLSAALEWLTAEFSERTGTRCRVESIIDESRLTKAQVTALFRIVQESLTNVSRHSAATEIAVTLEQTGEAIILRVMDNGRGIREDEIRGGRSLGLLGMHERAAAAGGSSTIVGTPGQGTTVTVTIPLSSKGHAQ
jgi:signal transduction histidine kinase